MKRLGKPSNPPGHTGLSAQDSTPTSVHEAGRHASGEGHSWQVVGLGQRLPARALPRVGGELVSLTA